MEKKQNQQQAKQRRHQKKIKMMEKIQKRKLRKVLLNLLLRKVDLPRKSDEIKQFFKFGNIIEFGGLLWL